MTQPRRSARLALAALQDNVSDDDSVECMGDDIEVDSVEEPPVEPHCGLCNAPVEISGPFAGTAPCLLCDASSLQCAALLPSVVESSSVVCPRCSTQSPASVDFTRFQHLCFFVQCGGPSARLHLVRRAPDDEQFCGAPLLPPAHALPVSCALTPVETDARFAPEICCLS